MIVLDTMAHAGPADALEPARPVDVAAPVRKAYVKTYGCQMNVYDSERMSEALIAGGYQLSDMLEDAELVILNTCHIREKAAEKVYSELGRLRDLKQDRAARGQSTTVVVAGCVAQAEGSEIVRRAPAVDLVIGPQSYHRLNELVGKVNAGARHVVETEFPEDNKFDHLPHRSSAARTSAFLTVQEGCDKFCTFCVVPYTRGAEMSRSVAQLMTEATALARSGVRELTLLGQNVNAYHGLDVEGHSVSLAGLVRALATVPGLDRIRYTTSHPRDMTDDLLAAHRDEPKLMPFLHLPVQSGSDRILAAMNRKHTADEYLAIVERIRATRADMALSTDVIVGFPGETEEDFEATLALVREVGYAQAYTFRYSPRPVTPAANLDAQVPEAVAQERLARLQRLIATQQAEFNARCVGKVLPVLFEKKGRYPGQLVGRSPYLQAVHARVDDADLGQIVPIRILSVGPNSLAGERAH